MIIITKLTRVCAYRTFGSAPADPLIGELPVNVGGPFIVTLGTREVGCTWRGRHLTIDLDDFSRASGIDLHVLNYILEHPEPFGDGIIDGDSTYAIPIWVPDPALLPRIYPDSPDKGDAPV